MARFLLVWISVVALGACDSETRPQIWVSVEAEAAARSLLVGVDIALRADPDPEGTRRGDELALVIDPSACPGCYSIASVGDGWIIRGDLAGLGYGLTEALEGLGYRFPHPFATFTPARVTWPPALTEGDHVPWIEQRGLQLHTLHPIEALEPFWVPGEQNLQRACDIVRWIVRQRGNFVHWVALDNISDRLDETSVQAWRAHTRAITECAHTIGATAGVGIQLFGSSNLQKAFDLIDDTSLPSTERTAEMRRRLQLLQGLGIDQIGISFGEFSGETPEVFIASTDEAARIIADELPGVEVSATVHVGDSDEQKVIFMEQEFIYYFLIQFTSEPITPWVHTVMYYALDDAAGGVYHHDDFHEHREMLLELGAAGERVVHHPETAYWVAWDNSVPMYLPLYAQARHRDLVVLADAPPSGHVIFSSGWEWGYWQNDLVSLRQSYKRTERWEHSLEHALAFEPNAAMLANLAGELATTQHEYLVAKGLAPYLAGRDSLIELGFGMGIVGQPDRIEPDDVAMMDPAQLDGYETTVVNELIALAENSERMDEQAGDLVGPGVFGDETADCFELAALRSRFVAQLHQAALTSARGADPQSIIDAADATLVAAEALVARRHGALHFPEGEVLTATGRRLPTLYTYGYLREADTLCFWRRERIKLDTMVFGSSETLPACVL